MVHTSRVVIVGSGFVGSTIAYSLMIQEVCSEIVLIDANKDRADGESLDLGHGIPFVRPVKIWVGTYKDCATADVVIVTAGIAQKPGQTRGDLIKTNAAIVTGIVEQVVRYTKETIILMVTNPVDAMAYIAQKVSRLKPSRVIGSGTVLDSARFRYYCANRFGVNPQDIQAYILGEHGDSEVAYVSHVTVCGERTMLTDKKHERAITDAYKATRNAAYEIVQKKGSTYYAIGLAVTEIVRAIVRDEHAILPVSTLFTGQYGVKDVYMSFPSKIGRSGVERMLDFSLSGSELKAFRASAKAIKKNIAML